MLKSEKSPLDRARLYYAAGLDPWLLQSQSQAEELLKVALLTTPHIVISDNQFLNSGALQGLIRREDFQSFMSYPTKEGRPPILLSMREGAKDFDDILHELLLERERPPIFPWMTAEQQQTIDKIYTRGCKTTGPFYDVAGQSYQQHVVSLNRYIDSHPSSVVSWRVLDQRYPSLVAKAAYAFLRGLDTHADKNPQVEVAKRAVGLVLNSLETKVATNRSNLFRILETQAHDPALLRLLTLKLLDEPYHVNFASEGHYNLTTGTEYARIPTEKIMQKIALQISPLKPEEILDVTGFPATIRDLPFSSLLRIRQTYAFNSLTEALSEEIGPSKIYVLRDLLTFIAAELDKEPKPLQKIGQLRIKAMLPPSGLRSELARAGLTAADMVGLCSKLGGFLAGESIGQMVGVFGIGGAIGSGATIVVEHLVKRPFIKPQRKAEFSQVMHMLLGYDGIADDPIDYQERTNI